MGVWFGLVAGLVEAVGLLWFQRINWENWGRTLHVSPPILWISPAVDCVLFVVIALIGFAISRFLPRVPSLIWVVFLLTAASIYDWLALTGRLYHTACLLVAIGVGVVAQRWFSNHTGPAMRLIRSTVPLVVLTFAFAFITVQGGSWWREHRAVAELPAPPPASPNVLVIIFDALRADHVSGYGYSRPTTPEMDRLATRGVLFDTAISASSWSLPSHTSLVTGRYQYEHGAETAKPAPLLRKAKPTFRGYPMLGEALANLGYRTGAFSGNRVFFTQNDGFARGFQHFEDYFQSPQDAVLRTLYGRELVRLYALRHGRLVLHKRADVVNREVIHWIDRDRSRPFLAYLNYFDVHDPYGGPSSYPKPAWPLKSSVDEYDAGARYDDDCLGRLLRQLEERGILKNTIVIVTSDHGESLGQHALLTHSRALYWELIHVPLVISYPGHVPEGLRIRWPVSNAAIPATVMDLVAHGAQNEFPGPPLSRAWKVPGADVNWPAPLSELARNPYPEKQEKLADQIEPTSTTGAMASLVTPHWHLIIHSNLGSQLYDWTRDPREENNLIATPGDEQAAAQLVSTLPQNVAQYLFSAGAEHLTSASILRNGTFDSPSDAKSARPAVNDYYRVAVTPGSDVTIEVKSQSLGSHLDPVLAIQDSQLEPLRTCRNPGDDHLRPPAVSDRTPAAYDDLCINDDIKPGAQTDSRLELMVPPSSAPEVQVYVHVLEWNILTRGRKNYEIIVNGAAATRSPTGQPALKETSFLLRSRPSPHT
jgi:arylsulfatase A-like enzyme